MLKIVMSDELKNRVMAEVEKDGNGVAVALGKWFCSVVDELSVEVVGRNKWIMNVDEEGREFGTCPVCGYNEYTDGDGVSHRLCPECGVVMAKEDDEE